MPKRTTSDKALAIRRQRFEDLFEANYGRVVRYARRRVGAAGSAEDVAAEVFLTAWRRLDDVPLDALPWLLRTAQGVLSNHVRAERRGERLALELSHHVTEDADRPDTDGEVLRALAALPPADREALLLVAWEGLDHRQAATVVGASRVAFSARYARARRRLGRALDDVRGQSGLPAAPVRPRSSEGAD